MEIQTRHRKSAEANRPKGRALLALADRREVPVAAMFAALVLGMAAWVKSAFGGDAAAPETGAAPPRGDEGQGIGAQARLDGPVPVTPFSDPAREAGQANANASENVEDLGRIGRGPGSLDLLRFFERDAPASVPFALDGAEAAFAPGSGSLPGLDGPDGIGRAPAGGVPRGVGAAGDGGGGSGSGGSGGAGPGSGGSGDGGSGDGGSGQGFAEIGFEALFARLAEVARPFPASTMRDIGSLAIGDWISAHEMHRLRAPDTRPDPEAAFFAREDRTYQLLSNADTREAFLDRHFPSQAADRAGDAAGARLALADMDGPDDGSQMPAALDGIL